MKATFKSMYRSKKSGKPVFVYSVSGTEAEIQQFKEAQGTNLVVDEVTGKPLFFSTRMLSYNPKEKIDLIITGKGNVVADDTAKMFERAALVDQEAIKAEGTFIARANLGLSNGEKAVAETAPAQTAKPSANIPAFSDDLEVDEAEEILAEAENPFAEAEGDEPTV